MLVDLFWFNFDYNFASSVPRAKLLGGLLAHRACGRSLHPASHAVVVEEVSAVCGTEVVDGDAGEAHDAFRGGFKEEQFQVCVGASIGLLSCVAVSVEGFVSGDYIEVSLAVVEAAVHVRTCAPDCASAIGKEGVCQSRYASYVSRRSRETRTCKFASVSGGDGFGVALQVDNLESFGLALVAFLDALVDGGMICVVGFASAFFAGNCGKALGSHFDFGIVSVHWN